MKIEGSNDEVFTQALKAQEIIERTRDLFLTFNAEMQEQTRQAISRAEGEPFDEIGKLRVLTGIDSQRIHLPLTGIVIWKVYWFGKLVLTYTEPVVFQKGEETEIKYASHPFI